MSNKTDLKVNKVLFLFCENLVILEWYFCFYRYNILSSILKALQWKKKFLFMYSPWSLFDKVHREFYHMELFQRYTEKR